MRFVLTTQDNLECLINLGPELVEFSLCPRTSRDHTV